MPGQNNFATELGWHQLDTLLYFWCVYNYLELQSYF